MSSTFVSDRLSWAEKTTNQMFDLLRLKVSVKPSSGDTAAAAVRLPLQLHSHSHSSCFSHSHSSFSCTPHSHSSFTPTPIPIPAASPTPTPIPAASPTPTLALAALPTPAPAEVRLPPVTPCSCLKLEMLGWARWPFGCVLWYSDAALRKVDGENYNPGSSWAEERNNYLQFSSDKTDSCPAGKK